MNKDFFLFAALILAAGHIGGKVANVRFGVEHGAGSTGLLNKGPVLAARLLRALVVVRAVTGVVVKHCLIDQHTGTYI